ncbi:MAG: heme peroxidase family protein [Actinomycetota bacterium]|nr:heme peroxidase family protein [Actinomycetota bacterium]
MIQAAEPDVPITEAEPADENPTIPAGYTYLGQFLDHDITFDPVSSLTRLNDPNALEDFRTPRLDLDSVYGRGNSDQPYLYERHDVIDAPNGNNMKLLLGDERQPPSVAPVSRPDLPRNSQDLALIGDPRNDENTIVSQLQSLFLRFHNKMLSVVPNTFEESGDFFAEVQRQVRQYYQWIVIHDFLPRIVGQHTLDKIFPNGQHRPKLAFYRPKNNAFMPVEFSVAAYRYGHSMIRPSYSLSSDVPQGSDAAHNRVPIFSANTDPKANLRGFRRIPDPWGIDWRFFFPDLGAPPQQNPQTNNPYLTDPSKPFLTPQPSYRIDALLVDPLAHLPGDPVLVGASHTPTTSLAERNLQRGRALGLPSGQAVAHHLGAATLTDEEIWSNADDPTLDTTRRQLLADFPQFAGNAPLWFYVLREAERTKRTGFENDIRGGHHLGEVGGRIVAEVLIGLIWNDHQSYLYQDPEWRPQPPIARAAGVFEMSDLIRFTDS